MTDYAELEIRIGDKEEDAGYPVTLTLNREQEFPRGYLNPDALPLPTADPRADGEALFNWLFADPPLQRAWAEARGRANRVHRISLRIEAAAPELHSPRWELLRDTTSDVPEDLAATTATPFSRYVTGRGVAVDPLQEHTIKLLLAVANPRDLAEFKLPPIDSAAELDNVRAAMAGIRGVEVVRLPEPWSLADLEAALHQGVHMVHLVAHGSYSRQSDKHVLFLADRYNRATLINSAELAEMFTRVLAGSHLATRPALRLLFLASCQSATVSAADARRVVAAALVKAGVPAVVAMQDRVQIDTARAFSQRFYSQFLTHGAVDLACNEARSATLSAAQPDAGIPVLYLGQQNGQLLTPAPAHPPTIDHRPAIARFYQLMDPDDPMRVLRLLGEGKMGKSHLLTKVLPTLLHTQYAARHAIVDLRNQTQTIPTALYSACMQMGGQDAFPAFTARYEAWINRPSVAVEGGLQGLLARIGSRGQDDREEGRDGLHKLTQAFVKDLRRLEDRALPLIFDAVNDAADTTQQWLMTTLLVQLSTLPHVCVLVAGRTLPEADGAYAACCASHELRPVTEEHEYISYCQRVNADLPEEHIPTLAQAFGYNPGLFAEAVLTQFAAGD